MKILVWGLLIFSLAFILHVAIWRTKLRTTPAKALIRIFSLVLILTLICTQIGPLINANFSRYIPENLAEYLHICMLFISITLAYIAVYPAIEADSPTLVIVKNIIDAGPNGLAKEELENLLNDDFLIKPRITDLLRDRFVYFDDGKYRLRPAGVLFVRMFIFHRNLLRVRKGG